MKRTLFCLTREELKDKRESGPTDAQVQALNANDYAARI
jgi:hypothetical protein